MLSCNDCTTRIYDFETMRERERFTFETPINIAKISPDGKMLAVYGDCYQAEIYDRHDKVRIGSMFGH